MVTLPLFLIPILAGLCAQALKPILNEKWYSHLDIAGRKLPRYGGMPSAHSAFATSLLTTIGLTDGWLSGTFAVAAALFILILDDALRMRMFLGRYGVAIMKIVKRLPKKEQEEFPYLEERLGHRPIEVVAGGTLGLIITLHIFYILNWL